MQIVHSQTKNHSAESEKSSGAEWGKAVWEKAPKRPPKREKIDWKRPAKSQNGRFGIHLATIKKLPETPLRFTGTIRHAPKPTGLPAKRQPKPPFPYKQETAKPMRIVYFPPRPHSFPNERFSRGETYFLTFCRFSSSRWLPTLIHWKCTDRPAWFPQRISEFHGKTSCCKTR